jgi:hypothetical protein
MSAVQRVYIHIVQALLDAITKDLRHDVTFISLHKHGACNRVSPHKATDASLPDNRPLRFNVGDSGLGLLSGQKSLAQHNSNPLGIGIYLLGDFARS